MLAIFGALLIGLTLGLLGSGGSILTVPVLVYLIGHENKVAIAESLAIVGCIALTGMLSYASTRQINWRSVVYFGLPGMFGTYGGAWLARFVSGTAQLVLFGGVMLVAAWLMFRNAKRRDPSTESTDREPLTPIRQHPFWQIALEGAAVGALTGLVGVGGGFLVVPALVILIGLPMRTAVGTSLAVISLNSSVGFFKYLGVLGDLNLKLDWNVIGLFVAIGVIGSLVGRSLSNRLDQVTLRKVFAAFLVVMGLFVLSKEAPRLLVESASHSQVAPLNDQPTTSEDSHDHDHRI